MRIRSLTPAIALAALALAHVTAATPTPPDLSGSWELDGFRGGAPLGSSNDRSVCAAAPAGLRQADVTASEPSGPSAEPFESLNAPSQPEQLTSSGTFTADLTIKQTPTAISIERRYGGTLASGTYSGVYRLDSSESVNAIGAITSRTHSRWNGAMLVIEGRLAVVIGKSESICVLRETFERGTDDALHIETSGEVGDRSRTSTQTYVVKK